MKNKFIKFTLTAAAGLVLSTSVMAKMTEGKLVIWINGDKGYNGLAEVGKKFEKVYFEPVFSLRNCRGVASPHRLSEPPHFGFDF